MTRSVVVCLAAVLIASTAPAQSATSQGLTLRGAVEYALSHSPDLSVSGAEVLRRQASVTSARALLRPQVDLSADAAQSRYEHGYPAGTTPSLLRFDSTLYTGSADLRFLAWDFGRTELELRAARERVEAARSSVERRRQEIVFETARLYLQTLAFAELIEAAEARIASLSGLVDRTTQLLNGGRAVPVDVLKVRTRLAQVESDLATLRAGRRSSLSALAAVMGFEGDLPEPMYTPPGSEMPAVPEPERDLLRKAAVARPEISAQDHEIRAGEFAAEAARKSAWPRIDLRASAIQYGSNTPVGFPQLIGRLLPSFPANVPAPGNAATDWMAGVHITWPLFDGGRRKGQIEAAEAQLQQARSARRQLEMRVTREVRSALADLESARSRVKSLESTVAESERVLHDERLKFEAGRSIINFVLDAESALLNNQSLLSQAKRSVAIAGLALDLSLGKLDPERTTFP